MNSSAFGTLYTYGIRSTEQKLLSSVKRYKTSFGEVMVPSKIILQETIKGRQEEGRGKKPRVLKIE